MQAGIEDMVKVYQQKFGLDKPLWRQYLSYIDDVSHGDLNYSIANYPRTVAGMIADALPWTIGLAWADDAVLLRRRHYTWRAARLAGRAALDAMADAAVMGAACHPVLPAWPGVDVPVRLPVPMAADLRRLQRRRQSGAELGLRAGRAAPRGAAGAVHRAGLGGRLGAGDARHDGHHHGRGLRHLRRSQRPAQRRRSSAATAFAMRSCRRSPAWLWHWGRSCPARCWWR